MKIKTDFLIIGSGISGLSLAIKLSKLIPDGNILLITKESIQESSTFHAQGGIACVWDEDDSFEKHIHDTMIAGDGLCDENVVKAIITQAPEEIVLKIENPLFSQEYSQVTSWAILQGVFSCIMEQITGDKYIAEEIERSDSDHPTCKFRVKKL